MSQPANQKTAPEGNPALAIACLMLQAAAQKANPISTSSSPEQHDQIKTTGQPNPRGTTPMKQWETEATRELSAIIYELAYGQYESKAALVNRLRTAAEAIELTSTPITQTYIGRTRHRNPHQPHLHKRHRQQLQQLHPDNQPHLRDPNQPA